MSHLSGGSLSAHGWRGLAMVGIAVSLAYAPPTEAAEMAKIGALMPLTGGLAEYGQSSLNGVKLVIKQVNEGGGILGGELGMAVGDTQTNPQAGVEAAKRLVSIEGAHGVVGALSSGVTIPVATSVTSASGVPQISSASTAPTITTLNDKDFLFRSTPHDALQGVVLGDLAYGKGLRNVAIVYVNNDYGQGLNDAFAAGFKGKVTSIAYEPKQASYRGELTKAAAGGAKTLLLIAYPEDGIPILRQSLEGGLFKDFVFTDGMKSVDMITAIGAQHLNGMWGTAPEAVADSDAAIRFREAYEKEYGELPPLPFIDNAYDATFLLALAIQKAGSTNGTKIRDALREIANPPGETILPGQWAKARGLLAAGSAINYTGAAGSQDFDAAGDVPGTFAHWVVKGGKLVTLEIVEPKM